MNFFKQLFNSEKESIDSYSDFWNWFQKNEKVFFKVVKERGDIENDFFKKLSAQLNSVKDGFWYLTGMYDDSTVELIITADGAIKNIVFVEELIASAPNIKGWKFTALKPELDIKDTSIEMSGYKFDEESLRFCSNDHEDYPDEIDISIFHSALTDNNKDAITNGVYIFLDNYLGELNFAVTIDNLRIENSTDVTKELIPIGKLKDYLMWRQKEFIEKYEGLRYDTINDEHSVLEAELESGNMLLAVVNTELMKWDDKASHPWIMTVEIPYSDNNNGMPTTKTCELLDEIENSILEHLTDVDGYLNIGRQTSNNLREIYFACKEFRKPSKVLYSISCDFANRAEINYDLYKDKYWQSLNQFNSY